MTNNDLLIRLRYALDIRDIDMLEIFRLGGIKVTKEELRKILVKRDDDGIFTDAQEEYMACNNKMLDGFLNGFVTFKRGPQEPRPNQGTPVAPSKPDKPNNLFFKKVKVALSLTTDDIMEIFEAGGNDVSKGEISAVLRKADHRNYKECLDSFIRRFLQGLTVKYRGES